MAPKKQLAKGKKKAAEESTLNNNLSESIDLCGALDETMQVDAVGESSNLAHQPAKSTKKMKKDEQVEKKKERKIKKDGTLAKNTKDNDHFKNYIHKVLKQVHPDLAISKSAMSVMDSFVKDMFERCAKEASILNHQHNKNTMTAKDIEASVKLLFPGDLCKHAISEGTKALALYNNSIEK